ncbi:DUF397 domain-containing protein [Streptomyces sp. VRA16 Mangrove soil]|uniref:DUF397 domain-containing protein n=1 Tax=Streptomyces sp. VRA16 Mangrove soil TaxID=2817434 RepID=UPI0027DDE84D|nr:DUF397 domain-containing protein [Streptomyces sp. VRA16 Mangrove soil]
MKSSHSTSSGECVEVARSVPEVVAIRDSEVPHVQPVLRVSPRSRTAFTDSRR